MKTIIIAMLMIGELFASGTIMIEVAYEGENYSIKKAWVLEQTFPPTMQGVLESEDDIIIALKDKDGRVVDTLRIENPRLVRGILSEVGNEEGHEEKKEKKGSFILRYAYDEGLKYLKIINANGLENHAQQSPAPKGNSEVSIEPSHDMEFGGFLK